tara:strand:+ start:3408 stop:3674 length:267 start_codon:yes stop_codon:yes gene_type:complete
MKSRFYPYNLEDIKEYLLYKNYDDLTGINYGTYKNLFKYLYPSLSDYYLRRIVLDLEEENFFKCVMSNRRRFITINTNKKKDISRITF